MKSIIQVLKLNDLREGVGKVSNKAYRMQDAECIVLGDDGTVEAVGVLMLPSDLVGKVQPGIYVGRFSLAVNKGKEGGRRIEARLVSLDPYTVKGGGVGVGAGVGSGAAPAPVK